jgi:hypothetical protein
MGRAKTARAEAAAFRLILAHPVETGCSLDSLWAHVLFGKPVPTFPGHALIRTWRAIGGKQRRDDGLRAQVDFEKRLEHGGRSQHACGAVERAVLRTRRDRPDLAFPSNVGDVFVARALALNDPAFSRFVLLRCRAQTRQACVTRVGIETKNGAAAPVSGNVGSGIFEEVLSPGGGGRAENCSSVAQSPVSSLTPLGARTVV